MKTIPRILFFVEPCIFRDNPFLLSPWIEMIDAMVGCSKGRIEAHLATSRSLSLIARGEYASRSESCSAAILEPFGFDRVAYMRDVCVGDGTENEALIRFLSTTRDRVIPDVVVTWTENSALRRVFAGTPVLYMELGPMPRTAFTRTAHIDPYGHQIRSIFDRFAEPRWDPGPFEPLIREWLDLYSEKTNEDGCLSGLFDWLRSLPSNRRKVVVALQPPDWLTYEGIGPTLEPLSLLRHTAASAGPDDLIIPQWHVTQVVPSDALLADLESDYPNVAIPPNGLKIAQTEGLLLKVDKVVTISSNVALAAAVLGRELTLLGQCKFSALATPPDAQPVPRTDLIPFLVGSYCRPLSEWIGRDGAFVERLCAVADNPENLLVPPPPNADFAPFRLVQ